jgi:hypothetical protein
MQATFMPAGKIRGGAKLSICVEFADFWDFTDYLCFAAAADSDTQGAFLCLMNAR